MTLSYSPPSSPNSTATHPRPHRQPPADLQHDRRTLAGRRHPGRRAIARHPARRGPAGAPAQGPRPGADPRRDAAPGWHGQRAERHADLHAWRPSAPAPMPPIAQSCASTASPSSCTAGRWPCSTARRRPHSAAPRVRRGSSTGALHRRPVPTRRRAACRLRPLPGPPPQCRPLGRHRGARPAVACGCAWVRSNSCTR